jgi:hypothetical protein
LIDEGGRVDEGAVGREDQSSSKMRLRLQDVLSLIRPTPSLACLTSAAAAAAAAAAAYRIREATATLFGFMSLINIQIPD